MTPFRTRHLTYPAALLAVGLLAGCTGDPSMVTGANSTPEPAATTTAPMQAGPLILTPEDYWVPPVTANGVTTVSVGGCGDGEACPSFTVTTGEAVPTDPVAPVIDDGVACPGGLVPTSATLTEATPATLAHGQATLAVFDLVCAGPEEQTTVTQRQWHADGPAGPVVVVDRWLLDGVPRALAEATWAEGA